MAGRGLVAGWRGCGGGGGGGAECSCLDEEELEAECGAGGGNSELKTSLSRSGAVFQLATGSAAGGRLDPGLTSFALTCPSRLLGYQVLSAGGSRPCSVHSGGRPCSVHSGGGGGCSISCSK